VAKIRFAFAERGVIRETKLRVGGVLYWRKIFAPPKIAESNSVDWRIVSEEKSLQGLQRYKGIFYDN
jgi:hypothetical protein